LAALLLASALTGKLSDSLYSNFRIVQRASFGAIQPT
jgi:hypothetical protein